LPLHEHVRYRFRRATLPHPRKMVNAMANCRSFRFTQSRKPAVWDQQVQSSYTGR